MACESPPFHLFSLLSSLVVCSLRKNWHDCYSDVAIFAMNQLVFCLHSLCKRVRTNEISPHRCCSWVTKQVPFSCHSSFSVYTWPATTEQSLRYSLCCCEVAVFNYRTWIEWRHFFIEARNELMSSFEGKHILSSSCVIWLQSTLEKRQCRKQIEPGCGTARAEACARAVVAGT